jgi:hypothetical protein
MTIRKGDVRFICSPGYSDGWGDGFDGYEVEKNHGPKPTGGHWLRFYRGRGKNPETLSEVTSAE